MVLALQWLAPLMGRPDVRAVAPAEGEAAGGRGDGGHGGEVVGRRQVDKVSATSDN